MTDEQLLQDVRKALARDRSIDTGEIVVSVHSGVVTLRGDVSNYAQKAAAERAAFSVAAVKAVANDVNVYMRDGHPTDSEIAEAALSSLRCTTVIWDDKITISVSDGWVTLQGSVRSDFERMAATHVVRDLTGVRGVTNNLMLESHANASQAFA
jgi:osmotically-inducible protein OsmY